MSSSLRWGEPLHILPHPCSPVRNAGQVAPTPKVNDIDNVQEAKTGPQLPKGASENDEDIRTKNTYGC